LGRVGVVGNMEDKEIGIVEGLVVVVVVGIAGIAN